MRSWEANGRVQRIGQGTVVPERRRGRSLPSRRRRRQGPRPARTRLRLSVVGLIAVSLFGALLARLWYLQVLQAPTSRGQVIANAVRTVSVPAPRGIIEARGGQVLAGNKTVLAVTLQQQAAAAYPWVEGRVAKLLGMTTAQVKGLMNSSQYSPYQPVPLAVGVPTSTVIALREHQSSYPGVAVQLDSERTYPDGTTASHLLGYVGQINSTQLKSLAKQGYQAGAVIGESGVESSFQQYLRGAPGQDHLEVDAQNQVVGSLGESPPRSGDTVVLSVDLGLQRALDKALAGEIQTLRHTYDPAYHQNFPATAGAAVVMDPNTGRILAMASYPTYNPSVWVPYINQANYNKLVSAKSGAPLLNRAIAGLYTPGSTFKLATSSAALQSGLITPTSLINDPTGVFTLPGCNARVAKCSFHDALGEHPGLINISYAIGASDDVFFYTLGYRFWTAWLTKHQYGPTPIQNMANAYGLGVPTGIDIPGESVGFIDSPGLRQQLHKAYPSAYPNSGYYAGDNIEMAFGQGMTEITPLQLAQAYSTFANGGTRYQPQVAEAVVSPSGKVVKRLAPKVLGHVPLTPQNRAAILRGFKLAVSAPYGTAYYTFQGFPLSSFPIAGKTGTASHTNAAGAHLVPDSLFVGFGPLPHSKYVIASVIQEGGYGASGAGYVARSAFSYLRTHPVKPFSLASVAPGSAAATTKPATSRAGGSRSTTTTSPRSHGATGTAGVPKARGATTTTDATG